MHNVFSVVSPPLVLSKTTKQFYLNLKGLSDCKVVSLTKKKYDYLIVKLYH